MNTDLNYKVFIKSSCYHIHTYKGYKEYQKAWIDDIKMCQGSHPSAQIVLNTFIVLGHFILK